MDNIEKKIDVFFIIGIVIVVTFALLFILLKTPSGNFCEVSPGWECSDVFISDSYAEFYLRNIIDFDYFISLRESEYEEVIFENDCFLSKETFEGFVYDKNLFVNKKQKFKVSCVLKKNISDDVEDIKINLVYNRIVDLDEIEEVVVFIKK